MKTHVFRFLAKWLQALPHDLRHALRQLSLFATFSAETGVRVNASPNVAACTELLRSLWVLSLVEETALGSGQYYMPTSIRAANASLTVKALSEDQLRQAQGDLLDWALELPDRVVADPVHFAVTCMNESANLRHARMLLPHWAELWQPGEEQARQINRMMGLVFTLRACAQFHLAEPLCSSLLAICQEVLGPTSATALCSMVHLAIVQLSLGKLVDAEGVFQRMEDIHSNAEGLAGLPPAYPPFNRALVLVFFGECLLKQGKFQEAEAVGQRALHIVQELDNPLLTPQLNMIRGYALTGRGRHIEAEPALRETLRNLEEGLASPDGLSVCQVRTVLGSVLRRQHKLDEAEELHRSVVEVCEKTLGPLHLQTTGCREELGVTLVHQGHLAEAEACFRAAVDLKHGTLGPLHPETATSMYAVAVTLTWMGRLEDAADMHSRALDVRSQLLAEKHLALADSYDDYGVVLRGLGQLDKAERLHQDALAIRREVLGAAHVLVSCSLINLAAVRSDQMEGGDAKVLCEEALALREKGGWPSHPNSAVILATLGKVQLKLGKVQHAVESYKRALDISLEATGAAHPLRNTIRDQLAEAKSTISC